MFVFVLVGKVISNGRTSTNGDSLAPKSRVNPLFAQNQTQKNQMFWKMGGGHAPSNHTKLTKDTKDEVERMDRWQDETITMLR